MIRQSTQTRLPVRLLTPAGANATGILPGAVLNGNAQTIKSDGNKSTIALINNTNWFEVDSVQSPGLYHLQVSATDTNTIGNLQYTIYPSGAAFLPFVASDTVDIDISTIKAKTDNLPASPANESTNTAIKAKTDLIGTTSVATQADVTNARDNIKGANNIDLTNIAGAGFVSNADSLKSISTAVATVSASGIADAVWDENLLQHIQAGSTGAAIRLIRQALTGRVKIDVNANTLIIYAEDGTTALLTLNLKDSNGNAASTSAIERTA